MGKIQFSGVDGTFVMEQPENYSNLYFPIAGEKGIKSSVTPNLGGDSKINQESFLLEPVSVEIYTVTAAAATFGVMWKVWVHGLRPASLRKLKMINLQTDRI